MKIWLDVGRDGEEDASNRSDWHGIKTKTKKINYHRNTNDQFMRFFHFQDFSHDLSAHIVLFYFIVNQLLDAQLAMGIILF